MNNYVIFEISEFEKKLNGYIMLFNYRLSNLCVQAEPLALVPVTVQMLGNEFNLEDVATVGKKDDYTFDVFPNNQNNLLDIVRAVAEMHPEFKMEVKTEHESDGDVRHALFTMPDVNKERHDVLNETAKVFHDECKGKLKAYYGRHQAEMATNLSQMPIDEADEARKELEKRYNEYKDICDNLLKAKQEEIENGYQRYLQGKTNGGGNTPAKEAGKLAGEEAKLKGEAGKMAGDASKLAGEAQKMAGEAGKMAGSFDVTSAIKVPKQ